jgi:hypothetical protein
MYRSVMGKPHLRVVVLMALLLALVLILLSACGGQGGQAEKGAKKAAANKEIDKDESFVPISNSIGQLTGHFLTSLAVDVPTLSTNSVLTYPPPILAAIDAPLSPTPSAFSHNNLRKLC